MTFSIVARDAQSGMLGIAVTTKFFGVGSLCPFARAGVGAVATQALVNPTYGPRGLDLLARGLAPDEVADTLLQADEGRDHRQLHLIDASGRVAARSGSECIEWFGHQTHDGFSVAGNMLAGPRVIAETARAYEAARTLPLAERLIQALEAGQAAGGDKRGRQSAALLIVSSEVYPYLDIRVDDHPDPVVELRRLYEESKAEYLPFKDKLPSAANPHGIYGKALTEAIIAEQAERDRARLAGAAG
ncbi:MAG TPA: DUF1028 domain-containing protein [Chloroflexota bacterium]|nr:DUF1028 domain-containing protein [Chloroflexota bacterium]